MSNAELETAYETVIAAEKALVTELADLAASVKTKLEEIKAKQPTLGSTSVARQFLGRVESNLNSVFSYDLDSVRNSYGMNVDAPAATNSTEPTAA